MSRSSSPIPADRPSPAEMLLQFAAERVEVAYLKALKKNLTDPAVFVFDLDDYTAQRMARAAGANSVVVRGMRKTARRSNVTPVVTWYVPRDFAATQLPAKYKQIGDQLLDWSKISEPGMFPVIVMTCGQVALCQREIPDA